jgi:beta-glucosidase
VQYAKGCDVIGTATTGFAEAVEAARGAKVAIVVVGDKGGLADDCTSGEARDRADLDLPGVQKELVKAVYDTGTPVLLVLVNGRPVSLGWIAESVPAIVEAWFPSEEGADAIAEVLFGDVNPGGKLPITFPRSVGQVPIFYGHKPSGGRSHWKENYVETSVKPLYPFGYGLSYTRFEFHDLRIEPATARAGDEVTVQVNVTNVGERGGDEVVQLYTHQQATRVTRPVKELRAFQRITLEPGQTRTVTFHIAVNQLGFYDLHQRFIVEPGTVEIMVGSSSQDIHGMRTLQIAGETVDLGGDRVFFSTSDVS